MSTHKPLHLFEGYGVELEYMIVSSDTLDVRPICDQLIHKVAGGYVSEIEMGELSWSNELVLHVVELKTNGPAKTLNGLADQFQEHVRKVNDLLKPLGAMLMPTGMHPWIDPMKETHLWPHEYNPIYEGLNRIFNCQGHGWANLQSVHLNLPFANDEEFARLHAAVRLLLPIMPALAASSPIFDGQVSGSLDSRLDAYRTNCLKIPLVTGHVIPEPVYSKTDYEQVILNPLYQAIAPFDPDGVLQYEWLNARGAIARFDRNTIEIRLLDSLECPAAELAILEAICAVLQALVEERWAPLSSQQAWPVEPLAEILLSSIRSADAAQITDSAYLHALGYTSADTCTAGELWRHLIDSTVVPGQKLSPCTAEALTTILEEGSLSRRIVRAISNQTDMSHLQHIYRDLCTCLAEGKLFHAKEASRRTHL